MQIRSYDKGKITQLSRHFLSTEFDCYCQRPECRMTFISDTLIGALEALRLLTGGPLVILSGYRCADHNKEIGGAPDSEHVKGTAADLLKNGISGKDLGEKAEQITVFSNGGIGTSYIRCHVDCRGHKARWTYPLEKLLSAGPGECSIGKC